MNIGMPVRQSISKWIVLLLTIAVPVAFDMAWADAPTSSTGEAGDQLGEIVVTAQKRAQNVQDVPIAITAIGGDVLQDRGISNASSLAELVPNVTFNSSDGETRIGIRGITFNNLVATGGESRVAYFLDGIYISPAGNIDGTLYDVDRVEVLRGPQGTLSGRNAIAGSVNTVTRDPTDTYEGYLQERIGNYDEAITEVAVGGPIADGVSFRIAARTSDHSGYGEDLTTHEQIDNLHQRDFRAKLKFQPNDALKIVLSADYTNRNDNSATEHFGGYEFPCGAFPDCAHLPGNPLTSPPGNLRDTYAANTPTQFLEYYGYSANVNWNLGDGLALTSLSSYRSAHETALSEDDFSNAGYIPAIEGDAYQYWSEELRLQKDFSRGHIMGGLYYFGEWYESGADAPINTILFGGPNFLSQGIVFGGEQRTRALGAFSEGTIDFTDALHLTLGVRYSLDRKNTYDAFDFLQLAAPFDAATRCQRQPCNSTTIATLPTGSIQPPESSTWHNISPRVTFQYDFDEAKNVYFTFSKGFKSGGYNLSLSPVAYNPETLTDYEIGLKADYFGRRLRTNVAAFFYNYKNLQVAQDENQTIGNEILNAAGARLFGIETEIDWLPIEYLRFNLAASLEKSYFTDFLTLDPSRPNGPNGNDPDTQFNLAGNELPSAPKFTATYGAQYTWPTNIGGLTLRGEGNTTSHVFFDQFNEPTVAVGAYTVANAYFNYESNDHKYYGSIYGRNVTNEFRIAGATVSNGFTGNVVQTSFIPPRTYGIMFGIRFGK